MKSVIVCLIVFLFSNLSAQTLNLTESNLISSSYTYHEISSSNTDTSEIQIPERKSPYFAFASSLFLPGFGQIYNEELVKGIIFFSGIGIGVFMGINLYDAYLDSKQYLGLFVVAVVVTGGLWLWQLIDAPVSSVRINKERNSKFELTPAFNNSGYGASLKFYF